MPYDRQLEDKFRFFNARIVELEKAAAAQDIVIKQFADKLGVEVDLINDHEEIQTEEPVESAPEPLDLNEIMGLLEESQREDDS